MKGIPSQVPWESDSQSKSSEQGFRWSSPCRSPWGWFTQDRDLEAVKEAGSSRGRCLAASVSAVALGDSGAEMALRCCPASQRQGCRLFPPAHGPLAWTARMMRAAPEKGLGELPATSTTSSWGDEILCPEEGMWRIHSSIPGRRNLVLVQILGFP